MAKTENYKVVLGPYKGLSAKRPVVAVSDKELEAQCRQEQKNYSQMIDIEDRPVEAGDIAVIDFKGFCDGVAFDGGAGDDYPLEIGSGTFIPGFEDQLIGAEIGAEVDVNVTFPENYGAANLAGKDALFKVRVKKIQKYHYPDLAPEIKEEIRKNLLERKQQAAEERFEGALLDAVINESEIEITDEAVSFELENLYKEWCGMMTMRGIPVDQYVQMTGNTEEGLRNSMRPQAILRLKSRLVLEAIAQTEGIEVSEIELERSIGELARGYKKDKAEVKALLTEAHMEALTSDIRMHKALDIIKNNIVKPE